MKSRQIGYISALDYDPVLINQAAESPFSDMLALSHLTPIRNALRIISADRSPRQIAGAIALGVLIGLLPKGNLLALFFTVLLFSVRVNLGVGLSVAFVLSLANSYLDPLTHGIGVRAFQSPTVYGFVSRIYDWPLVPWTALNNTVVLGSAVLGLSLMYPVYHLSHRLLLIALPAWRRWWPYSADDDTREQSPLKSDKRRLAAESIPANSVESQSQSFQSQATTTLRDVRNGAADAPSSEETHSDHLEFQGEMDTSAAVGTNVPLDPRPSPEPMGEPVTREASVTGGPSQSTDRPSEIEPALKKPVRRSLFKTVPAGRTDARPQAEPAETTDESQPASANPPANWETPMPLITPKRAKQPGSDAA